KSIEHLTGVARGCSSEEEAIFAEAQRDPRPGDTKIRPTTRAWETYDDAKAQALFVRFVRNGTWQCPTLTMLRATSQLDHPQFVNDNRLKYMSKAVRWSWVPKNNLRFKDMTVDGWAAFRVQFSASMKLVGRMQSAGVNILAGTDAFNPFCFPGFSLHDELAL